MAARKKAQMRASDAQISTPRDETPRVHFVEIANFMGLEALQFDVPAKGALIEGGNATGKTSVLEAVRAALYARGVDPGAVRLGADRAEVFVDLGAITVRRLIPREGRSTLTIKRAGTGDRVASPQGLLDSLLGLAPYDPIAFYREHDAKERRAMVLKAMPLSMRYADLARLVDLGADAEPVLDAAGIATCSSPDAPIEGHALDVLDRVRSVLAAQRQNAKEALKRLEETRVAAERQVEEARRLLAAETREGDREEPPSPAEANAAVAVARAEHQRLLDGKAARERSIADRNAGFSRADYLDGQARMLREQAARERPTQQEQDASLEQVNTANNRVYAARAEVLRLERALEDARKALRREEGDQVAAVEAHARIDQRLKLAEVNENAATEFTRKAELERRVLGPEPEPFDETTIAEAKLAIEEAQRQVERAERAGDLHAALEQFEKAAEAWGLGRALVERTDARVKQASAAATALLAESAGTIPGLSVEGEQILLEGKDLLRLSGAERLFFATELARRLNAQAKILLVDELETLDADQLPAFVAQATADGYQLLATRVTRGTPQIRPIEDSPVEEPAAS